MHSEDSVRSEDEDEDERCDSSWLVSDNESVSEYSSTTSETEGDGSDDDGDFACLMRDGATQVEGDVVDTGGGWGYALGVDVDGAARPPRRMLLRNDSDVE